MNQPLPPPTVAALRRDLVDLLGPVAGGAGDGVRDDRDAGQLADDVLARIVRWLRHRAEALDHRANHGTINPGMAGVLHQSADKLKAAVRVVQDEPGETFTECRQRHELASQLQTIAIRLDTLGGQWSLRIRGRLIDEAIALRGAAFELEGRGTRLAGEAEETARLQ